MAAPTPRPATQLSGASPQFLVHDLEKAIAYYRDRLGFKLDYVYQLFFASLSRDGFTIQLKCSANPADATPRKPFERIDAHVTVSDIEALYGDLQSRGARIVRRLEQRSWAKDFFVEDPEGYILCFSQQTQQTSKPAASSFSV
jgi:uncharacterized glyoxalase superfamily protein PhnB